MRTSNKMKFLIVLFAILAITSSVPSLEYLHAEEWVNFKAIHNKQYASVEEELKRLEIFNNHLIDIAEHNKLYDAGLSTYKKGVTKFTDWTKEEFLAFVNRRNISSSPPEPQHAYVPAKHQADDDPVVVDWRANGAITDVKNTEQCGASWAYAAVGALESQYSLTQGNLVLSEQHLIDCSSSYGNDGCGKGSINAAYEYIQEFGIHNASFYPNVDKLDRCKADEDLIATRIKGFVTIGNEDDLLAAVRTVGPIAVFIDATDMLQNYDSGIIFDVECSNRQISHGALLVAVTENTYILKNSWGSDWGEDGYVRYGRYSKNICGIGTLASYPIL